MSELFAWSDSFSVGIEEIDEQHRELVILLNHLHGLIVERRGDAAARTVLDELVDYTRTHFLLEESLMRISGYPGFDAHRRCHEELMGQVRALQDRLDRDEAKIGLELSHFLKAWLMGHIGEADKRFAAHFLASGGAAQWTPQVRASMRGSKSWWRFW